MKGLSCNVFTMASIIPHIFQGLSVMCHYHPPCWSSARRVLQVPTTGEAESERVTTLYSMYISMHLQNLQLLKF